MAQATALNVEADKLAEDERKANQSVNRSARAKAILEDELFTAAVAEIERRILAEWRESPARDTEGRERLWEMLKLQERLVALLKEHIETGQIAAERLGQLAEQKRTLLDRLRRARAG